MDPLRKEKKMNLYVIRHGQTDINQKHYYNCRNDEDLNETGVLQAKTAGEKIGSLPIDLILCSPLTRARHTCELINVHHVPVIIEPALIERDGGILTNTPMESYDRNRYYHYYETELPEGLESLPALFARVHGLLDRIIERYHDQNVLLVTHGSVSRAIQYYFEPLPEDGMILSTSGMRNCEVVCYADVKHR